MQNIIDLNNNVLDKSRELDNCNELDKAVRDLSVKLGFCDYSAISITKLDMDILRFQDYLSKGYNAEMSYLERNIDKREDPALLLEGAKSILCFLAAYSSVRPCENMPMIASYAQGLDYHDVIKDKLKAIGEMISVYRPDSKYRAFTDSAPILERSWAEKAGLGFIGKNTMLISKEFGVHTLIGVVLSTEEVVSNREKVKNGCGKCRRCLDSCPNGAITEDGYIDANRCISYRTIESKKMRVEEQFQIDQKGWLFGCDICINACPWSSKSSGLHLNGLNIGSIEFKMDIDSWKEMTESDFKLKFRNTPLKRAGYLKIMDNLAGLK